MDPQADLEKLYTTATEAIAKKEYERAASLLKQVLARDETYKDASRLLAQIIQRKRRRWYNLPVLWISILVVGLITILFFILPQIGKQTTLRPITSPTPALPYLSPVFTSTVLPTATATSTPFPFAWKRISDGSFLSLDKITAIALDPRDADVLYIGTASAGVYKSINGGISWRPAHEGLENVNIVSLSINSSNPQALYASVGRGGGFGLYKTVDGGGHWVHADEPGLQNPDCGDGIILADPSTPGRFAWSTGCSFLNIREPDGVWHTIEISFTDGCKPYGVLKAIDATNNDDFLMWFDCGLYRITDHTKNILKVESPNSSQIITGIAPNAIGFDATVSWGGNLDVSFDGGVTWQRNGSITGCKIPITRDGNGVMYVICSPVFTSFLWRSSDAGIQWEQLGVVDIAEPVLMAVSPLNPEIIYVVDQKAGLYVTRDAGESWELINSGLPRIRSNLYAGFDGKIYIEEVNDVYGANCASNKLFVSNDHGAKWQELSDMGQSLAIDSNQTSLYRVCSRNLIVSSNNGASWQVKAIPSNSFQTVTSSPFVSGRLFGGDPNYPYIYVSQDGGITWAASFPPSTSSQGGWMQFMFNVDQRNIYAVNNQFWSLFHSSDSGLSWSVCGELGTQSGNSQTRLVIKPDDPAFLLLATLGRGVIKSTDACLNWNESSPGMTNHVVNSIVAISSDASQVVAGTDGGAFISLDEGNHWGNISDGLLGANVVYSLVADTNGNVFASTPYGIFKLEGK